MDRWSRGWQWKKSTMGRLEFGGKAIVCDDKRDDGQPNPNWSRLARWEASGSHLRG